MGKMDPAWKKRYLTRLGINISRLRTEAGMSRADLAELVGVSNHAIYNWESGRAAPAIDCLVHMALQTGWPLSKILYRKKGGTE